MTADTEKVKSETEKNKQDIKESEKRIESLTSQIHKTYIVTGKQIGRAHV